MRAIFDNLKIELETQQEIQDFWNIVMFALDLHSERTKKGESCMTESELKLANELKKSTYKSWDY